MDSPSFPVLYDNFRRSPLMHTAWGLSELSEFADRQMDDKNRKQGAVLLIFEILYHKSGNYNSGHQKQGHPAGHDPHPKGPGILGSRRMSSRLVPGRCPGV